MNWSSWADFFSMGGYGFYVWGSYLVTFVCVIGEVVLISKRRRTLVKRFGQTDGLKRNIPLDQQAVFDTEKKSSNIQENSVTHETANK